MKRETLKLEEASKAGWFRVVTATEETQAIMGILEQIAEIEAEMARTQKNKATEYHLGRLKAKCVAPKKASSPGPPANFPPPPTQTGSQSSNPS